MSQYIIRVSTDREVAESLGLSILPGLPPERKIIRHAVSELHARGLEVERKRSSTPGGYSFPPYLFVSSEGGRSASDRRLLREQGFEYRAADRGWYRCP